MPIPVYYHPSYSSLKLSDKHRFPIQKYQRLYEKIKHNKLDIEFFSPEKAPIESLLSVHDSQFVEQFLAGELNQKAVRKMGFPWSKALVERTLFSIGASIQGAKHALESGLACQISGGYHHSFPSFASGFCIFNDLVISAKQLINSQECKKVVILDLDVHQGDGTAVCAENEPDIQTVSIHCEQNFPAVKQHSDLDIGLNKGCDTESYLKTLDSCLLSVLSEQPDIILYNAGADIFTGDELGYFDICLAGVQKRDRKVINFCRDHEIPLFAVSGGGYQRNLNSLVDVHYQLYRSIINT